MEFLTGLLTGISGIINCELVVKISGIFGISELYMVPARHVKADSKNDVNFLIHALVGRRLVGRRLTSHWSAVGWSGVGWSGVGWSGVGFLYSSRLVGFLQGALRNYILPTCKHSKSPAHLTHYPVDLEYSYQHICIFQQ